MMSQFTGVTGSDIYKFGLEVPNTIATRLALDQHILDSDMQPNARQGLEGSSGETGGRKNDHHWGHQQLTRT